MRQRRLHWFGRIEKREDNSWLKKVQILEVDGHSGRGRPRKTWEHVIMEDLRVKGLRREVAQNRAEWRSATNENFAPYPSFTGRKSIVVNGPTSRHRKYRGHSLIQEGNF